MDHSATCVAVKTHSVLSFVLLRALPGRVFNHSVSAGEEADQLAVKQEWSRAQCGRGRPLVLD